MHPVFSYNTLHIAPCCPNSACTCTLTRYWLTDLILVLLHHSVHLFQETLKSGRATNYSQHTTPQHIFPLNLSRQPSKSLHSAFHLPLPLRQTQTSSNNVLATFRTRKGGRYLLMLVSPWNVNPARVHGILFPVLWNIIVMSPPSWRFLWSFSKLQIPPLPSSQST